MWKLTIKKFIDHIYFLKRNIKREKPLNKCNKVIWITEVGTRDFLPRLNQAFHLWEKYKISSIVIHKHFLKYLTSKDFQRTLVIDKSATLSCLDRIRYCRIRGATTAVIPEELITVNNNIDLVAAALHRYSLAQIDYIFASENLALEYAKVHNVTAIDCLNPRFNIKEIKKLKDKLDIKLNKIKKKPFIVINDNTFYEYSAYENEEGLIQNLFKKSGRKYEKYIDEGKEEDFMYRNNLKELVEKIYSNILLKDLDIVIRPHPAVNIDKFKSFFFPILPNSKRIKIERTGDALSIMAEAEGVFHQNCTTGLEGYYAGLNNIFNFAEIPRNGFSKNNLNIIPCLGINGSIKAFEFFLIKKKNLKNNNKSIKSKNQKNLYEILGEEMKNKDYKKINKNRNNDLKEIFETKKVFDKFNNGRWNYAEEILYSLKKKNSKYKKVLGLVGIIIGNWK